MRPASSKAKGRRGQQLVQVAVLEAFPSLELADVRSTAMGQTGADLQLSPLAQRLIPYQFEVKNKATSQIHTFYSQAKTHGAYEPVVVVKKDRDIALAVISFDHFLKLITKGERNED